LDCSDNDSSFSQDETYLNTSDSTYRTDISFPSTPGTYTCTVWDDYDYSYYSGAMGGQVTIALG
jgi:hypothetical protein